MLADGEYVDGSWLLTAKIAELGQVKQVRVKGEWSVGELMAELTANLPQPILQSPEPGDISLRPGISNRAWQDHRLWWEARKRWLLQPRMSLNQYGIQADACLVLLPIYGKLSVILPDKQQRDFVDVNFAEPIFRVTMAICRHLNIRHPEEISLARPISPEELKYNRVFPTVVDRRQKPDQSPFQRSATINVTHSNYKNRHSVHLPLQTNGCTNGAATTDKPDAGGANSIHSSMSQLNKVPLFGPPCIRDKRLCYWNIDAHQLKPRPQSKAFYDDDSTLDDPHLVASPHIGIDEALVSGLIVQLNGFPQRLRLNATWLDSSRSLHEQGIPVRQPTVPVVDSKRDTNPPADPTATTPDAAGVPRPPPPPLLCLAFKYGSFYDLNSNYDAVRINQLFEQAKWSVLSGMLDASEEEACLLGAIQAQVEITTEQEKRDSSILDQSQYDIPSPGNVNGEAHDGDQVDSATLTKPTVPRDVSPIGGYFRGHAASVRRGRSPARSSRPQSSIVDIDSEIDRLLEQLTTSGEIVSARSRSTSRQRYSAAATTTTSASKRPKPAVADHRRRIETPSLVQNQPESPRYPASELPQLHTAAKVWRPTRLRASGIKLMHPTLYLATTENLKLQIYKSEGDFKRKSEPSKTISLPGCEVQPDLCVSSQKFIIHLFTPVSRTNLPLSVALGLTPSLSHDNSTTAQDGGDLTMGGRMKRRASLLSLTSVSQFKSIFGIQSANQNNDATGGGGGLCGPAAAVLGLLNEIILKFTDAETFADWLAYLRLATSVPSSSLSGDAEDVISLCSNNTNPGDSSLTETFLTKANFDAERKAINSLIYLTTPSAQPSDQVDQSDRRFHNLLNSRLCDFIPLKMGRMKGLTRSGSMRRSGHQLDASGGRGSSTLLSGTDKHHTLDNSTGSGHQQHSSQLSGAKLGSYKHNLIQRMSATYSRIHQLSSFHAKLKYISVWEQLPNHGIAFFPVRIEITLPSSSVFRDTHDQTQPDHFNRPRWLLDSVRPSSITVLVSKRLEALGIGPTRIFRCDLATGEILASWRLSAIQSWHFNRELNELVLHMSQFSASKADYVNASMRGASPSRISLAGLSNHGAAPTGRIVIRPYGVSVRVVAEFLGGYAFLNLRSPEKNQFLDEATFYRLTTGSTLPKSHASPIHAGCSSEA